MRFITKRHFTWFGFALFASLVSGCVFVGDYDDFFEPAPKSIMYETCYTDFVNAICTVGCFDDLDCAVSEFNGLPGACVDHAMLGGPASSRICIERCEFDVDCDLAAGFGCEVIGRERICVPVH